MAKSYLFHDLKAVKTFVKKSKGKTLRVWFIKDDETIRKMKCNVDLDYKPKPRADGQPNKKLPETSVFIFDQEKEQYRSFRADRVIYMALL